jgi:hypothetical protein
VHPKGSLDRQLDCRRKIDNSIAGGRGWVLPERRTARKPWLLTSELKKRELARAPCPPACELPRAPRPLVTARRTPSLISSSSPHAGGTATTPCAAIRIRVEFTGGEARVLCAGLSGVDAIAERLLPGAVADGRGRVPGGINSATWRLAIFPRENISWCLLEKTGLVRRYGQKKGNEVKTRKKKKIEEKKRKEKRKDEEGRR